MSMNKEIAEQIVLKIKRTMDPSWSLTREAEGFILDQPKNSGPLTNSELWTETWRVAQAVKFEKFLSIEKNGTDGYLILSRDDDENWFQILIE